MTLPARAPALLAAAVLALGLLAVPTVASAQTAPSDVDCADFSSQAAAQAFFDLYPGDPFNLDADGDGIVCETFDYSNPPPPTTTTTTTSPPTSISVAPDPNAKVAQELQSVRDAINNLQCGPTHDQDVVDVINAMARLFGRIDPDTYVGLENDFFAREADLNYCVPTVTPDPGTSGDQVSIVPTGSAETGGA